MPDQNLSLEDILNEYSPDSNNDRSPVGRVAAQKIINSTILDPEKPEAGPARPPASHNKKELFDNSLRRPEPAADFKPADLSRSKVSFVSSEAVSEIKNTGPIPATTNPLPTIPQSEAPKIRRMTDSTRAREMEIIKSNTRHRRGKTSGYTYEKETPEGEYMYTPPAFRKKKRSHAAIRAEAESPEGRKLTTDIVPSPAAVEAAKPVEPAPRAELTSIDLSQRPRMDAGELDVHITQETDEYVSARSRRKRTKRMVDFNYYGDVEDVGRDIYELKSTISVRVLILAMTAFLGLFITVANQLGLPLLSVLSSSNTRTYLWIHLLLGLISLLSSTAVISKGLKKLFTLRADGDSMTAVTALSCFAAILPLMFKPELSLEQSIHLYMPIGSLALFLNAFGKMLIIRRAARNFRFVSRSFDRHGIVYVHDEDRAERLTRGTLGDFPILASMRKTDFLTDFLRYTYSSDMTDDYCRKATPLCLLGSLLIALVITFFTKGTTMTISSSAFFFSIYSMLICATSCIAMPFVVNIPLESAADKAFQNRGIMLGYQSVDDFYDTNSILVNADMLFPEGHVKLSGIKVFSNTKIDEALLEAASLTHHAGSMMRRLFSDVTAGREDMLYPIENFSFEESMGLCGWINNKRVLFGNRELMTSHNIEGIPTKTKENEFTGAGQEAMYLSISGNLAAMFIVELTADSAVKRWAKRLSRNKVFMIIKSVDPCISLKKLSTLFGVPEEMMRILPKKLHDDFDEETKKAVRLSASMACSGKFSSLAQLIIGTKSVHAAAIVGLIFQTASIMLGFGLSLLMILSKAFEMNYMYMSETALIVYNLAWALLTYIAVSVKHAK